MADIKISALTDGGEALATDDVLVVRAGANRRVRPPVPFGPYADGAALQTAKPASAALAGRTANIGSVAPYVTWRCNGSAWVDPSLPTAPVQVGGSRPLASTDNGLVLECTATATLTVPASLPAGFRCVVIPFGTMSVAFTGTTGNGAGTTITRAAASNAVFGITQRGSSATSYVVDGV